MPTTKSLTIQNERNLQRAIKYILNPEKTKSYDVGIEYKGFSVTYFNTKVKNMIDWETNPLTWAGTYKNLEGTSKLKGIEVGYKNSITEDIFLNLNYTNLSAKNDDNEYLAKRAKNKLNFGADYYGLKDFHFNINGEYIGTRYERDDEKVQKLETIQYGMQLLIMILVKTSLHILNLIIFSIKIIK